MQPYGKAAKACVALILAVTVVVGQKTMTPAFQVTEEHLFVADPDGRPMVEPTLAIDPEDPKHWVVAAIVASPDLTSSDCALLTTVDAGHTWKRSDLHVTECFDPWLGFVGKNEVVVSALEKAANLRLFHSRDGGRSWIPLQATASAVDHETFTSNRSPGASYGELYLVMEQDAHEPVSGADVSSVLIMRASNPTESFHTTNVFPALLSLNAMNPVPLEDGLCLYRLSISA